MDVMLHMIVQVQQIFVIQKIVNVYHLIMLTYVMVHIMMELIILVIYGLLTLYMKIKDIKSTFWLFKINTWAVYIGFVLFAIPDWDIIITKHNLNHELKDNMETSFLLTLDEKVLPLYVKVLRQK